MSDLIEPQRHELPWHPTSDATLVEVFHQYDGPRLGVLVAHGVPYLFQAVIDMPDGFGIWAYTALDEDEAAALRRDPAQYTIDKIVDYRTSVLAVSTDGRLLLWTAVDGLRAEEANRGIAELRELLREMTRASESMDAFERVS